MRTPHLAALLSRRSSRRLTPTLSLARAAVVAMVLAGFFVAANAAQAAPPTQARATGPAHVRHGAAPTPTCAALRRVPATPAAWVDDHSERSPLVRNIAKLICSAADHATIDIKSWFVLVDDPTVKALVADLRLMHTAHHVRVNVLVGRDIYRTAHWSWPAFTRAFSFAHIADCYRECGNNAAGTVPHGKWMTVSALKQGGPAVLSMSTNWTSEQFRSAQSGVFIPGDTRIYHAFVSRWKEFRPCYGSTACTVPSDAGWQDGSQDTAVYFAPIPDDLTAGTLSGIDCSNGGTIAVLSLFFHRAQVEEQLLRLQAEGCHIRIVLEHAPSQRISDEFPTRCEHQHDKAMVIDVPGQQTVIAGSESLTTHALTVNENQTIRSSVPGVVDAYHRYLDGQWRRGNTCVQS